MFGQGRQVRRYGVRIAAQGRAGGGDFRSRRGHGFYGGAGQGKHCLPALGGGLAHLRPQLRRRIQEGGHIAAGQHGAGVVQGAQFVGQRNRPSAQTLRQGGQIFRQPAVGGHRKGNAGQPPRGLLRRVEGRKGLERMHGAGHGAGSGCRRQQPG